MVGDILKKALVESVVEGTARTISGNGKGVVENSGDVFFEKGDKAIDDFFDPLTKLGGFIDDIFGW
jgi:hypothetical protein